MRSTRLPLSHRQRPRWQLEAVARGQNAAPNPGSSVARGLQLLDQSTPEHSRGLDGLVSRRPQNWPQTAGTMGGGHWAATGFCGRTGPLHAWGLIHADRIPRILGIPRYGLRFDRWRAGAPARPCMINCAHVLYPACMINCAEESSYSRCAIVWYKL